MRLLCESATLDCFPANPLLFADSAGFSHARNHSQGVPNPPACCTLQRKPASGVPSARNCFSLCTNSGHAPVDGVHSLENTWVTNPNFLLTEKIKRVETYSFFDSF